MVWSTFCSMSKRVISCFRWVKRLAGMVCALFSSVRQCQKMDGALHWFEIGSEKSALRCLFGRGGGQKLFGQCPFGNNTFQKGLPLVMRTNINIFSCSAVCVVFFIRTLESLMPLIQVHPHFQVWLSRSTYPGHFGSLLRWDSAMAMMIQIWCESVDQLGGLRCHL